MRFLPLARRRASVFFPPGVFIRTRKPWDLARLRFFGLYVNDMMNEYYIISDKIQVVDDIHNLSTYFNSLHKFADL